jgi:hypothetical protein
MLGAKSDTHVHVHIQRLYPPCLSAVSHTLSLGTGRQQKRIWGRKELRFTLCLFLVDPSPNSFGRREFKLTPSIGDYAELRLSLVTF